MKTLQTSMLALGLSLINACAGPTLTFSDSTRISSNINSEQYLHNAESYLKQKNYRQSLENWLILATIDPKNREYKNRIHILQLLIKRRSQALLEDAIQASLHNDQKLARSLYLKTLTLDPTNKNALGALREINTRNLMNMQALNNKRLEQHQLAKTETTEHNHAP